VWDYVRTLVGGLIGEATTNELVLVAVIFVIIRLFTWAPALGERIGGFFEDDGE
jgi:hypothetical protein